MPGFIKLLFTAFAHSITSFLYIFIIMIVYQHINMRAQLEETWLGFLRNSIKNRLLNAMLYGMITGLTASILITAAGVPMDLNTILLIWFLALLLSLLNFRYFCFSYAGGAISLISLIFGWPKIQVPAVIAIIGILHLVESVLILADGHRDALPVVMEHKRFTPIGAFVMNRLWPVPLVILAIPSKIISVSGAGIPMPDWWPAFGLQKESGLILLPLSLIMQFSGLAITGTPRQRTRITGLWLGAYSMIILGLSVLSVRINWLQYIAAILVPLLHEWIIHASQKSQLDGRPVFGAPWRGLRILDVLPESMGSRVGLKPGDILLNVNGQPVNSEEMISDALNNAFTYVWMDVKRQGEIITLEHKNYKYNEKSGVIFVPRKTDKFFQVNEQRGLAFTVWKRLVQRKQ